MSPRWVRAGILVVLALLVAVPVASAVPKQTESAETESECNDYRESKMEGGELGDEPIDVSNCEEPAHEKEGIAGIEMDESFYWGLAAGVGGAGGLAVVAWASTSRWIRRLGALLFWPAFARLSRRDVEEHPLRSKILAELATSPGLSTTELAARTESNVGTLEYHLAILRKAGKLRASRAGRDRIYFLSGVRVDEAAAAVLAGKSRRDVASIVLSQPGIHVSGIAKQLSLRPATVLHHVAALELAGLVRVERGLRTRCWPSDRLHSIPPRKRRVAVLFDNDQRNA